MNCLIEIWGILKSSWEPLVEISRKTTLMREKKSSEELPAEDLIVAMTYYEPLRIVEVGHWKPTLCPNFCERCKTSISCEHLKVVQMQFYISNYRMFNNFYLKWNLHQNTAILPLNKSSSVCMLYFNKTRLIYYCVTPNEVWFWLEKFLVGKF